MLLHTRCSVSPHDWYFRFCHGRCPGATGTRSLETASFLQFPFQTITNRIMPSNATCRSLPQCHRQKLLAAYHSVRHFHHFLEGCQFMLFMDHKPLVAMMAKISDMWLAMPARHVAAISEFTISTARLMWWRGETCSEPRSSLATQFKAEERTSVYPYPVPAHAPKW